MLARSSLTLPIPGFKTVQQVEENAGVLAVGPLDATTMIEIDRVTQTFTEVAPSG